MFRASVRAGQIMVEIFQNNNRSKLQEEVNQWLNSHYETLVYDIQYSYGYILANPSDTTSQHYSHGYSISIVHSTPSIKP
jgi:hypothetical protein